MVKVPDKIALLSVAIGISVNFSFIYVKNMQCYSCLYFFVLFFLLIIDTSSNMHFV